MKLIKALAFPIMVAFSLPLQAQGSIEAGKTKYESCAACHGAEGNSTNPEWPKLAGQNRKYIIDQLKAFKSGARTNALMSPMAAPLSDEDMSDLAGYLSSRKSSPGKADADLVAYGEKLYRGGNSDEGLPACMACHGPAGDGNPGTGFPDLSGQHAAYITAQLKAYRARTRTTDQMAMMRDVAAKMTDDDMNAVSSYISGLHY